MYKIDKKLYGFSLTFADSISEEEMKNWLNDSKKALAAASSPFGVLIDMRTLKPISNEARAVMEEGQKAYKQKGMQRSAVILASSMLKLQFKNIAKDTGIYEWERYIDASSESNWEKVATDWISKSIDPDK